MAEEFPDQDCFRYTTLDYTRTYAQFREDADNFARALVSLGVKPGSKVAVWATNVPAWFICFWAAVRIGAVLVTMNTAYKIHEADYLLRQSDTHTLVMIAGSLDSDYRAIINELCPEIAQSKAGQPLHCRRLPFLRNVITVGFRQPGSLTFEDAMARRDLVPAEEIRRLAARVRPDDVCNMQYTSGTTGFPKGVMSVFGDHSDVMSCRNTGFAMVLSVRQQRARVKAEVAALEKTGADPALSAACAKWLAAFDDPDASRAAADALIAALENHGGEAASAILAARDQLAQKTFWMFGGDGWAYDIGFGGLDHVIASGENVNVFVVDTEVYSNTGGQASKASNIGQVAQFAAAGKEIKKKSLAEIAMLFSGI